ncbi:EF hand [Streptomyces sp. YIM 130001]|uniref:EF-hand domain-containing protein n=1 Tax=Streptomyces sp. YIM 130001 TaxID=2259644 RepID=UPI000E64DD35|nr:EF-hand domain-containing protein [Streptomyces sp. YIM 130001]RII15666.1 EF hand [Streptomyces sp. YIM 130001]
MADIDEARKTFERFDANADGFITADEFSSAMVELGDYQVSGSVAQAVIGSMDTNKDGLLSFDEFWAHVSKSA